MKENKLVLLFTGFALINSFIGAAEYQSLENDEDVLKSVVFMFSVEKNLLQSIRQNARNKFQAINNDSLMPKPTKENLFPFYIGRFGFIFKDFTFGLNGQNIDLEKIIELKNFNLIIVHGELANKIYDILVSELKSIGIKPSQKLVIEGLGVKKSCCTVS